MRMDSSCEYAGFFSTDSSSIIIRSPYDGHSDTLIVDGPFDNIVCMSASYVAYLDAIGCDSVVSAVSGLKYISSQPLRSRAERGEVIDVGYESSLDYEAVLSLKPDLVVAYSISAAIPPYVERLQSLGINVLLIYEHLENHPLARAEYVKLFGALTGRRSVADSVFVSVRDAYKTIEASVDHSAAAKVLLNIPYSGQWFIPGADNYMSTLIRDAGGEVLGSVAGQSESSVISLEEAYVLSQSADYWLNTGWCESRKALVDTNPLFEKFDIRHIYNNTARRNAGGGNDFWESGAVRPDLILRDLVAIFSGKDADSLYYYVPVQ